MPKKKIVDVDVERTLCAFYRCPKRKKGCDSWLVTLTDNMRRVEQVCCDATPWERLAVMKQGEEDVVRVRRRDKSRESVEIVRFDKYKEELRQKERFNGKESE